MDFLMSRLDFLLRRLLWPGAMGLVTYVACLIVVHDKGIAFAMAMLPFTLGFIGVFARYAYLIAGLSVVVAVVVSVTTPKQRADAAATGGNVLHASVDKLNSVVDSEAERANMMREEAAKAMEKRRRHAKAQ